MASTSIKEEATEVRSVSITEEVTWADDPNNPWNWPGKKKALNLTMFSIASLSVSIGTSIITPARTALMQEFGVSSTVALLPLSLYVLALGFGPVVGGPVSETWGRYPVYTGTLPLGALFTLGCGFTHSFGALCFLRFMAGFFWGSILATSAGSLADLYDFKTRGPASGIYILTPFLGPALGPVIGSYVVSDKGWRWTQWTLLFLAVFCLGLTALTEETFHPIIKARLAKKQGKAPPPAQPLGERMRMFVNIALIRPLHMLLFEPIVFFICLYVAAEFGTLFSFFAGVPYTFGVVYRFSLEQSGLVFLSIAIGSFLGLVTIVLCDVLIYRKQIPKFPPNKVPPEHRLYSAMIGSIGLPVGLFWFAWSAKEGVSWASPAAAMIPFAWGVLCVFISTMQYIADAYQATVVASAASANALARYGFASVFPLFTIQMYEKLGIDWATSLLGFVALALLPVPWVFFKFGPQIRERSKYEKP